MRRKHWPPKGGGFGLDLTGNLAGAGLVYFYDNFTRGDGVVGNGWLSGTGATAVIASNCLKITPSYGLELIVDGDMELVADVTNWPSYGTPTVKEKSAAQKVSGSLSLHSSSDAAEGAKQAVILQTGRFYRASGWFRKVTQSIQSYLATGEAQTFILSGGTTDTWVQGKNTYFETVGASRYLYIIGVLANYEWFADDISVKPITLSSCFICKQWPTTDAYARANITAAAAITGNRLGAVVALNDIANPTYAILGLARFKAETSYIYARLDKLVNGVWTNIIADTQISFDEASGIGVQLSNGIASLWYGDMQIGANIDVSGDNFIGKYHGIFSPSEDQSIYSAKITSVGQARKSIVTSVQNADGVYAATPGLAILPNTGKLIIFYAKGTAEAVDSDLVSRTSDDGGVTWSAESILVAHDATYDAWDCCATVLSNYSTIIVTYMKQWNASSNGNVMCLIGTIDNNDTITWGSPVTIGTTGDAGADNLFCSSPIVELINGNLLMATYDSNNDVYLFGDGGTGGSAWSQKVKAVDGGVGNAYSEAVMVQIPSGRILMLIRNSSAGIAGYYLSYTDDPTGESGWTEPSLVVSTTGIGRPMFIRLASGNLFFVGRYESPYYSAFMLSNDNGVTWESPHYITNLGVPTNRSNLYAQCLQLSNHDIAIAISQLIDADWGKVSFVTVVNDGEY